MQDVELARGKIARQLVVKNEEERVAAMKARLAESNRHQQATNLAHQTLQVEVEELEKELQLAKDINVVLTIEKIANTTKIAQLEEKLKSKEPIDTLALSPSPTLKMSQDDQLLGLANWIPTGKILEHAYLFDSKVFFLLMEVE